jgi:hypothetical protein
MLSIRRHHHLLKYVSILIQVIVLKQSYVGLATSPKSRCADKLTVLVQRDSQKFDSPLIYAIGYILI